MITSVQVGAAAVETQRMARVVAGSRLVLFCSGGAIPLRALADVEVARGAAGETWLVPVMAPATAMDAGSGIAELPTDAGLVRLPAQVRLVDGAATLVPIPAAAPPRRLQRRRDVRGAVRLPVRGADLGGLREAVHGGTADVTAVVEGTTASLSGGGFSARVAGSGPRLAAATLLYVELDLPGGRTVTATTLVLEHRGTWLRVLFDEIAFADRERLVRLVFAHERLELAARRSGR
jgi:hypothetical protein